MSVLPREAREGLMRAWLKVLSDRHPDVTWVPAAHGHAADEVPATAANARTSTTAELANSA
jgi:hypothetical protein